MWIRNILALLTALLVLVSGVVSEFSSRRQAEAAQWVAHTQEVIGRVEATRGGVATAESAARAFLLTGEQGVLSGYAALREAVDVHTRELVRLTEDNPRQQERLRALRVALQERFALLDAGIALRQANDTTAAVQQVRQRGLAQSRTVQEALDTLRGAEEQLLRARLQTAERARHANTVGNIVTSLLALGLLGYLYRMWWRHERQIAAKAEELRRLNEGLQESALLLEQRVEERTSELSEANAELESFSRTVAHDLRAPVRNIQAYASAVLEDQGDRFTPEAARFMQRLIATSQRMEDLIAGLLEYSRLSRAHLPVERVELQPLVAEALGDLRPDIETTHAEVRTEALQPAVLAHRGTLLRVVENLVANALKFVRPGEPPQLRIHAERHQQEVVLAFEDRGIGIDLEDQERIFLAFERLHGQETYPGTGVGLAIVRRGVERMGGRVTMESAPGTGSRFELHLKAA